jgi:hypothetical protein
MIRVPSRKLVVMPRTNLLRRQLTDTASHQFMTVRQDHGRRGILEMTRRKRRMMMMMTTGLFFLSMGA